MNQPTPGAKATITISGIVTRWGPNGATVGDVRLRWAWNQPPTTITHDGKGVRPGDTITWQDQTLTWRDGHGGEGGWTDPDGDWADGPFDMTAVKIHRAQAGEAA